MQINKIERNGVVMANVYSEECLITDTQSALDLIMSIQYETGCNRIILNKEAVTRDFFILSTGLAGEILQKFINYDVKAAIYGDYSKYTSKPLKDFMYESNHGKDVFFHENLDAAADALSAV